MATIDVLDANGDPVTIQQPLAPGQAAMAASVPVVIASNQSAIPISDGAGSITVDGTVAATQSGTWNVNNIAGTVSLPTGAATSANQSTGNASLVDILTELQTPVAVLGVQPMMAGGAALSNLAFTEARINVTASGDTELVSATASQTTKVYRLLLQAGGTANTVQIKDGSTVLIEFALAANEGVVLDFQQYPWFTTSTNTALNINLSGATSVQGRLYYIKGA